MAWLGLSGCGFGLSSEVRKSQAAYRKRRLGLDAWTRKKGRELRKDFLVRERIETAAKEQLSVDPESEMGWALLSTAFKGKDQIEHYLDLIDGSIEDRLSAFKQTEMEE